MHRRAGLRALNRNYLYLQDGKRLLPRDLHVETRRWPVDQVRSQQARGFLVLKKGAYGLFESIKCIPWLKPDTVTLRVL